MWPVRSRTLASTGRAPTTHSRHPLPRGHRRSASWSSCPHRCDQQSRRGCPAEPKSSAYRRPPAPQRNAEDRATPVPPLLLELSAPTPRPSLPKPFSRDPGSQARPTHPLPTAMRLPLTTELGIWFPPLIRRRRWGVGRFPPIAWISRDGGRFGRPRGAKWIANTTETTSASLGDRVLSQKATFGALARCGQPTLNRMRLTLLKQRRVKCAPCA